MKRSILIFAIGLMMIASAKSQIGFGYTAGFDLYQLYDKGDPDDLLKSSTSGSAIANLIFGPKMWVGGKRFSLSLEAPINWGIFQFDLNEYKGIGALAFPLGAKLNFGSASGFSTVDVLGFSLGGGIQFMNTEIYGTKKEFRDVIDTGYFSTYYGEVAFAVGISAFNFSLYVRYGMGEEEQRSLNVGLVSNFNLSSIKKLKELDEKNGPADQPADEMTYQE